MHHINLLQLCAYVEDLPPAFDEKFNMRIWARLPTQAIVRSPAMLHPAADAGYECGAICCMVGYGPAAGLKPMEGEAWEDYSERVFELVPHTREWNWCFASAWDNVDNTRQGACRRIRRFVEHGKVPDWFPHPFRFNFYNGQEEAKAFKTITYDPWMTELNQPHLTPQAQEGKHMFIISKSSDPSDESEILSFEESERSAVNFVKNYVNEVEEDDEMYIHELNPIKSYRAKIKIEWVETQ